VAGANPPAVGEPAMLDDVTIRRRPGMIETEVDGELIGLHVDNGVCYGFNRTATRIWRLIEQPCSLQALCAALAQTYSVGETECAGQVRRLLDEMSAEGLLDLLPSSPTSTG
jgi:hypothetical protein